jgi:(hydroxyamino)benzene mutase
LGQSGFLLFTLGLVVGAIIPKFRNPRMGLSAHLTAVQTGTALIAIALFWPQLAVPEAWASALCLSLIGSSYFLTFGLAMSATTGASRILPIAGHGFSASKSLERIVAAVVLASSVWMLVACLVICACFVFGLSAA